MLVSGLTVMIAMAGMFLTGSATFTSFAVGTIIVVAVAMIGSVTVLPAVLAWLGDRVERGRVPLIRRRGARAGESRVWSAILDRVLRRPLVSAIAAGAVLVALTIPALGLKTALPGLEMKQMGVGLAVAVLIDATVVRAVLLPASMKLLGRWNWYLPKRLRWLPKLEHEPEPEAALA